MSGLQPRTLSPNTQAHKWSESGREIPDGCENKGHVGGERRREDPGSGATRHWGPCGGFAGKAAGIHREKDRMADKNRDTKPETGLEEKADARSERQAGTEGKAQSWRD